MAGTFRKRRGRSVRSPCQENERTLCGPIELFGLSWQGHSYVILSTRLCGKSTGNPHKGKSLFSRDSPERTPKKQRRPLRFALDPRSRARLQWGLLAAHTPWTIRTRSERRRWENGVLGRGEYHATVRTRRGIHRCCSACLPIRVRGPHGQFPGLGRPAGGSCPQRCNGCFEQWLYYRWCQPF